MRLNNVVTGLALAIIAGAALSAVGLSVAYQIGSQPIVEMDGRHCVRVRVIQNEREIVVACDTIDWERIDHRAIQVAPDRTRPPGGKG